MKKKWKLIMTTLAAEVFMLLSTCVANAQPALIEQEEVAELQVSGNDSEPAIIKEGVAGTVTWTIDENGLLRITGTGDYERNAVRSGEDNGVW